MQTPVRWMVTAFCVGTAAAGCSPAADEKADAGQAPGAAQNAVLADQPTYQQWCLAAHSQLCTPPCDTGEWSQAECQNSVEALCQRGEEAQLVGAGRVTYRAQGSGACASSWVAVTRAQQHLECHVPGAQQEYQRVFLGTLDQPPTCSAGKPVIVPSINSRVLRQPSDRNRASGRLMRTPRGLRRRKL